MSLLVEHMSNMLMPLLPMWSELEVEKDEAGEITFLVLIPAKCGESFELSPAFRLTMSRSGSEVSFAGDRRWPGAVADAFKPQQARMENLKAELKKFWFDTHSIVWATAWAFVPAES